MRFLWHLAYVRTCRRCVGHILWHMHTHRPFPPYSCSLTLHRPTEKNVELMRSLTFDPTLFPVSAESQLLITLLQSLAVLRLHYWCCHFPCPRSAASEAPWSKCCCHPRSSPKQCRYRLTGISPDETQIVSTGFSQGCIVDTVFLLWLESVLSTWEFIPSLRFLHSHLKDFWSSELYTSEPLLKWITPCLMAEHQS